MHASQPATGPKRHGFARAADVTVVLYNEFMVSANHAYKKGELDAEIIRIVSDVAKIIPSK